MAKILDTSPIRYTSRTFTTILNDINADKELADKPQWFKRLVAGVGDQISMINNAAVNNCYLSTAFTREAAMELCSLIGYTIPDATTSSGYVLFYLDPNKVPAFPISVAVEDLCCMNESDSSTGSLRFESRLGATVPSRTAELDLSQISANSFLSSAAVYSGDKIRLSGTLPSGISAGKDYYCIPAGVGRFRLATSPTNVKYGKSIELLPGTGTCTATFYSFRAYCYQQEQKKEVDIGSSDGVSNWQEFFFTDVDILLDTLQVIVNSSVWERVDSLAFSRSIDPHYQVVQQLNRKAYIRFGNNEYGSIPPNFPVLANYCVGGGAAANVRQIGGVNRYIGGDDRINGCFNCEEMSGGSDPQPIEVAKRIAPGLLRAKDRFITVEDGETLVLAFGGASLALIVPNARGVLTANVYAIATGGGNPSAAWKSAVKAYLEFRSILQTVDVSCEDAGIVSRNAVVVCAVTASYDPELIRSLCRIGIFVFLSETSQEILDAYYAGGVENACAAIERNSGYTVVPEMWDTVSRWMEDMQRNGTRKFGETVQQSSFITFIQGNIVGIDYMTVLSPTFPLTHAATEISGVGTITVT